jgi:hypothetical protein
VLPSVPLSVDPDGWLHGWDGWEVRRLVSAQGSVKVDVDRYSVSTKLAGQWVTVHLDAHERRLQFWHQGQLIRSQPLKGLVGEVLPWPAFVATLSEQARSQDRRRRLQARRMAFGSDPSP